MADLWEQLQKYYFSYQRDERELTFRDSGTLLHIPPFLFGAIYVFMVMQLPGFLIKYKIKLASHIKFWMMTWNLFLSVLSIFMFMGITGPLFQYYQLYGLWGIICDAPHHFAVPGVYIIWLACFTYSKYFEMLDTVFLIAKNPERPVQFLHWYHHLTVMWFTWYASHWRLSA